MEPLEFLKDQFQDTAVRLPMHEAAFIAEFAKQYHEHIEREKQGKKVKAERLDAAAEFVLNLKFDKWYAFDDIPREIFTEVFNLIDEGFRGWLYLFDDFDLFFRKELKIKKSTDKGRLKAERLARFKARNESVFKQQMFLQGDSG